MQKQVNEQNMEIFDNKYIKDKIIKIMIVQSENNNADIFTEKTNKATNWKHASNFMSREKQEPKNLWKSFRGQYATLHTHHIYRQLHYTEIKKESNKNPR